MSYEVSYDCRKVFDFVTTQVPLQEPSTPIGIGLEKDGEMVAGVVYSDWCGTNIWAHVAAIPGRRWMTPSAYKKFTHACFHYPFVYLGVNRMTGWVEANNLEARRFDEHLGFKQEAVLRGAARDGGDVIIYVMFREDCRYV